MIDGGRQEEKEKKTFLRIFQRNLIVRDAELATC